MREPSHQHSLQSVGAATIYVGEALEVLSAIPDGHARCAVTSPAYWGGLRNYDNPRQLGMERQPSEYVDRLVAILRELRRVLADDGSLWLNIADSYAASGKGGGGNRGDRRAWSTIARRTGFRAAPEGFKQKDLVLTSFMVAEALRQDGWYLRKTIIWRKPSAIEPERADRPSLSHEYVFLLTPGRHSCVHNPGHPWWHSSVWDIRPEGYEGHPAAFPVELAARCILAGSDKGDTIIDPFGGSGTTAVAALAHGRAASLIELNDGFAADAGKRIEVSQRQRSLFVEQAA